MKDTGYFKEGYKEHLKLKMLETGVTLSNLAEKTGYSYEGVRQILNGNGSYWGVFKVCGALKVNMKEILVEDKFFQ